MAKVLFGFCFDDPVGGYPPDTHATGSRRSSRYPDGSDRPDPGRDRTSPRGG